MKFFRNYEIAEIYDVSQATVGKWVKAAQHDRLALDLYVDGARVYIVNSIENMRIMKKLAQERKKYRNSKASATVGSVANLIGIWRSEYTYHNSGRNQDVESIHYVRLYPKDGGLIMETIPEVNHSYMVARFSLDENIATCSWQQTTSPEGDYGGIIYHGAGQLIISDDGKQMSGKWVGFGRNMEVKTGPWKFAYLGDEASILKALGTAEGQ